MDNIFAELRNALATVRLNMYLNYVRRIEWQLGCIKKGGEAWFTGLMSSCEYDLDSSEWVGETCAYWNNQNLDADTLLDLCLLAPLPFFESEGPTDLTEPDWLWLRRKPSCVLDTDQLVLFSSMLTSPQQWLMPVLLMKVDLSLSFGCDLHGSHG